MSAQDRDAASSDDSPEFYEGTLMDGLENEPPYPSAALREGYSIRWWPGEGDWLTAWGWTPQQAIRSMYRMQRRRFLQDEPILSISTRTQWRWMRLARRLGCV